MRELCIKLLLQLVICVVIGHAELTINGPKCGVLTCQPNEYCSTFDNQCKSCADICDKNSHNFEEKLCVETCQDYLHDIRYARIDQHPAERNKYSGSPTDNSKDIDKLYTLVTTTLTLLIILILANVLFATYKCYTWGKHNDVKASDILNYFKGGDQNNDVEKGSPNGLSTASTATPKRDLRLQINHTMSNSEHPTTPATMTTSISRRPAEDSALDYAYDNHAMSGTPSPHSTKTARESNF